MVDHPKRIIRNAAECKLCGDLIVSEHRHDFKSCKCGAISVDGGKDYLRRLGRLNQIIDRSVTTDEPMPTAYDGPVYEGLTLKWRMDVNGRGGFFPEGTELHVLVKTMDQPYGELGLDGCNWLCRAANGETVWATLESCIDRGFLWKP